ncbi:Protein HOTHEAD [Triticum urartu]|uniref:Protein HOTHEAD n=1 Tax=Triticum urartu TaxID=4572 RepID=M7YFA6_TRIUA|nr:Protein HOTHEAD [Triticum urartu]
MASSSKGAAASSLCIKLVACLCFLGLSQGRGTAKPPFTLRNLPPLEKASSFPAMRHDSYDYIVVGGGTAGCPLAATLSLKYKVLVLERGGSPYGNRNVSYMENFHIGLSNTAPDSSSQAFVSTDGVINARARVLGGGTCINAGFYSRASSSLCSSTRRVPFGPVNVRSRVNAGHVVAKLAAFLTMSTCVQIGTRGQLDNIKKNKKDVGWEEDLVNESYPWVEDKVVQWPKIAPWQAALRDGLVEAGVSPFNGYTYDHVSGTKVGGTIFDANGHRHTAADLLAAGDRNNLRVLLHASVHKIVFDSQQGRLRPRAIGVQFADEDGRLHQALLNNNRDSEIIISSGAIGSPQLLLLSGIGPKNDLKNHNIPVVLHNKYVGKGMADNPMNSIFIPTKSPPRQSLIETVGITEAGVFIEASSGFGQSEDSIHCHHGIMSAEIGQLSTVPPKQRSLELAREYAHNKLSLPKEVFQGGFILEKIDGPLSTGHLVLADTDVKNNPAVTFNYFSHPQDLSRCVYGIKTIEKILKTNSFAHLTPDDDAGYEIERVLNMSVRANVNLIPKHTNTTESLEQFCKDTVITIWHYHGGCHVGKVVDQQHRVLGVSGLRVVDGSTFSRSPGTNPQATVMMMGRYFGVKILRQRLGRAAGV